MRSVYFVLIIVFFSVFFVQCCATKENSQQKPPFTISDAYIQDWVGGVPKTSGTNIIIHLKKANKDILPDYIYYGEEKAPINIKFEDESEVWVARFNNFPDKMDKPDIVMHSDSEKEFGNTLPIKKKSSFDLKENEIVMSYWLRGKIYYYKPTVLSKKETIFYPASPKKE